MKKLSILAILIFFVYLFSFVLIRPSAYGEGGGVIPDYNYEEPNKEKSALEKKREPIRKEIRNIKQQFQKVVDGSYVNSNIGVVVLEDSNGMLVQAGTGFLANRERGIVVTAAHVIAPFGVLDPMSKYRVFFQGKSYQAKVDQEFVNIRAETALLFLQNYEKDDFLETKAFGVCQIGEAILAAGYYGCDSEKGIWHSFYDWRGNEDICPVATRIGKVINHHISVRELSNSRKSELLDGLDKEKIVSPDKLSLLYEDYIQIYTLGYYPLMEVVRYLLASGGSANINERFNASILSNSHILLTRNLDIEQLFLEGMSGGPAFNKSGEIIGILSATDGGELLVVPIHEAESLLKKIK